MRRSVVFIAAVAAALVLLSASGCYRQELPEDQKWHWGIVGWDLSDFSDESVTTDHKEFPLGGAESIDAEIVMAAGVLELSGTSQAALEAELAYRPTSLEPVVQYSVDGTVGSLSVRQPDTSVQRFGNYRNEWDLRLAKGVPLGMRVSLGAGEGDLDFSSLELRTLDVQLGAGDVVMDFSGDYAEDVSAQVEAGVGSLTLRLPEDVGVRVSAEQSGIAAFEADAGFTREGDAYVNEAYGQTSVTIEVSIQSGIGSIALETVR